MNSFHRPLSTVREESPFVTPPRVLVMADEEDAGEAVALAEALDAYGAEAEVRLAEDESDEHGQPDAVIIPWATAAEKLNGPATRFHSIRVAVTEGNDRSEQYRARAAGFDLIVSKPVNASALMQQLQGYLPNMKL